MKRNDERGAIAQELRTQFTILGGLVALMWGLEIVNLFVFQDRLVNYGIRPHSLPGLWGILFAPFLHAGFGHLLGNTIPFLVLGWLIMLRETSDFWVVSAIALLSSGLGTWLIGAPNSVHIGASGVIFGYLGYLMLRGYFDRRLVSIGFSLMVLFLYGGLVWGVLPGQYGISWEGHLFGFMGGVLAARLAAPSKQGA